MAGRLPGRHLLALNTLISDFNSKAFVGERCESVCIFGNSKASPIEVNHSCSNNWEEVDVAFGKESSSSSSEVIMLFPINHKRTCLPGFAAYRTPTSRCFVAMRILASSARDSPVSSGS